jgi:glycosyltransferase involved in cell wall biosynthesis
VTNRPKISLITLARNEEAMIGQCLKSAWFCDERIIVDSFSTDRTVEIARSVGANVLQREWPGFLEQRTYALEHATGDWVLILDADEQATHDLGNEILRVITSPDAADGYRIPRILYHLGRYSARGMMPDSPLRLFRRDRSHIGGRDPHDKVIVDGRVARLEHPILHFSYADIEDHVATINRLSTTSAMELEPDGLTTLRMFVNPLWRFFNYYFLRGGFLYGGRGLYGAVTSAFYVFLKYAKLYERRLNSRKSL